MAPLTREHIVPDAAFEGARRREREALPVTTVLTDATAAQTVRHLTLKISRPTHYARLTMKSYRRCVAHDKGAAFVPDTALVAAIFGQRDAAGAQGVYFDYRKGARLLLGEERFRIEPMFLSERDDDGRALAYAKVGFRNFPFVVIADARLQHKTSWYRMWPSPTGQDWAVTLDLGLSLRCS